jgi:hypothetical protein
MSFNSSAFVIAGTAIAIFGVGLYIWDTRKDKVTSAFNKYSSSGTSQNQVSSTSSNTPSFGVSPSDVSFQGGSRRRKRKNYKKSIKRKIYKTKNL